MSDGNGSGFFCRLGNAVYVVTCAHVIDNDPFPVISDINGKKYRIKSISVSDKRDLALICVDGIRDDLPVFSVHDNVSDIEPNTPLVCYGDSEGVGVIVQAKGVFLGLGATYFETDAPIVPGNSGGPIILAGTDKVIGVAAFLTKLNAGKWFSGSRFDKDIRRFGVRIDNLQKEEMQDAGYLDPEKTPS